MIGEKNLEKTLNDYARSKGALSVKLSSPNCKGQPDRMFLFNGKACFMEMKGTGKKATVLQFRYIEQLRILGFEAEIVDNLELGKEMIDSLTS
jgi:hypothetical protein